MKRIENYIDEMKDKNIKRNVRLFPAYYMFACDFLFFYAIEFVFLTQVKGFSSAQVLLLDAMIPLFSILFNIPITLFVERVGKHRSLVLGNISMCLCLLLIILSQNLTQVIIAFLFNSIGFCLKNLTETNVLAESIDMKNKTGKSLFALAYSTGYKNYLILDGITSFFIGLTYAVNPYLPIIISLAFTVIATCLSTCFRKTPSEIREDKKQKQSFLKEYKFQLKDLFKSFGRFLKSGRLSALMLFVFFFNGFGYGSYSVREAMLLDHFNVDATMFGIIIASLTVIAGISSLCQEKLQKIFKNRTFTVLSLTFVGSYFAAFYITRLNIDSNVQLGIILALFAIQYCIETLYFDFLATYQKNFTVNKVRVKISSVFDILRYASNFIMALAFSRLVDNFEIDWVFLYIGIAFLIIMTCVLMYMKPRFGLKPEEYKPSELFNK